MVSPCQVLDLSGLGLSASWHGPPGNPWFDPLRNTPWKINMEPENDGLEDDFLFSIGWVFRFYVNLPGCKGFFIRFFFLWETHGGPELRSSRTCA